MPIATGTLIGAGVSALGAGLGALSAKSAAGRQQETMLAASQPARLKAPLSAGQKVIAETLGTGYTTAGGLGGADKNAMMQRLKQIRMQKQRMG